MNCFDQPLSWSPLLLICGRFGCLGFDCWGPLPLWSWGYVGGGGILHCPPAFRLRRAGGTEGGFTVWVEGPARCRHCSETNMPTFVNRLHAAATTLPFPQFKDHRARSLSKVYLATGGLHPTVPAEKLRDVLLQVARNFEQHANKGKAKHGEGHMPDSTPLTSVSNSISPHGSDFCRQMPMI